MRVRCDTWCANNSTKLIIFFNMLDVLKKNSNVSAMYNRNSKTAWNLVSEFLLYIAEDDSKCSRNVRIFFLNISNILK